MSTYPGPGGGKPPPPAYPVRFQVTKPLAVLVGYQDGHVGVAYSILIKEVKLRIEVADVPSVDEIIRIWRQRPPAPVTRRISDNVTAVVGFKDLRGEIRVATGIPLVGNFTISIPKDRVPVLEEAMLAEKRWLTRTPAERFLQGASE